MGAQAAAAVSSGRLLGAVPDPGPEVLLGALPGVPAGLALDRVARSHGWCGLPPYGYDAGSRVLHRVLVVPGADAAVRVSVDAEWRLRADVELDDAAHADVVRQLRWCLGLDDDVEGAPTDVAASRMLRSPTVWEDLVKTLCTTNCSWAATIGMVTRLVQIAAIAGTFPTPSDVLRHGVDGLRLGYRGASLLALAGSLDAGETDAERLRDPRLPDEDVVDGVLALRGFGPYAAEGMLGLLGRPRGLAVDSWIRARLGGVSVAEVRARYEPLGRWGGAQLWQDVTRDWFEA